MKFKAASATEPFTVDWTAELGPGITIAGSSFTVVWPDDGSLVVTAPTQDDVTTTVMVAGGIEGTEYEIVHQIDASDGRLGLQKTQTIKIRQS